MRKLLFDMTVLAALGGLLGWLAVDYVRRARGAPAPAARPKAAPAPLAEADLHRVGRLHWGDKVWPIAFYPDGNYVCAGEVDEAGWQLQWQGPWKLTPGGVVEIEETVGSVKADEAPRGFGDACTFRLELRRDGKRIVGTGWGRPLVLE